MRASVRAKAGSKSSEQQEYVDVMALVALCEGMELGVTATPVVYTKSEKGAVLGKINLQHGGKVFYEIVAVAHSLATSMMLREDISVEDAEVKVEEDVSFSVKAKDLIEGLNVVAADMEGEEKKMVDKIVALVMLLITPAAYKPLYGTCLSVPGEAVSPKIYQGFVGARFAKTTLKGGDLERTKTGKPISRSILYVAERQVSFPFVALYPPFITEKSSPFERNKAAGTRPMAFIGAVLSYSVLHPSKEAKEVSAYLAKVLASQNKLFGKVKEK